MTETHAKKQPISLKELLEDTLSGKKPLNFTGLSLLIAAVAFVLRGIYYFYQLGYLNTFHINSCYAELNGEISLYSVLAYAGVATILLFSNYMVYTFANKKIYGGLIILFFIEMCIYFNVIFILSNIAVNDYLIAIITAKNWTNLAYVLCQALIFVLVGNCFAFSFILTNKLEQIFKKCKKSVKSNKNSEENSIQDTVSKDFSLDEYLLKFAGLIMIITSICGIFYLFGIDTANEKTNFKVIEYALTDTAENISDKYLFQQQGSDKTVKHYVVLHETKEVYIIAPLYQQFGIIKKDTSSQKIIPKDNVLTTYYDDIQKLIVLESE